MNLPKDSAPSLQFRGGPNLGGVLHLVLQSGPPLLTVSWDNPKLTLFSISQGSLSPNA